MHKLVIIALTVLGGTLGLVPWAAGDAPGASRIVYSRGGDLYVLSLGGRGLVRLTDTPVWQETDPAVSPDGRRIAYVRRGPESATIWVAPLGGRGTRLTKGWDFDPVWSPDGRHLYFARLLSQDDRGPNFEFHEECGSIFRVRADGREPARLLTNPPAEDAFHSHSDPAVSPDGAQIAFTNANQCSGGTTLLALAAIDRYGDPTGGFRHLPGNEHVRREKSYWVDVPPEYWQPAWSPDGGRVVFVGDGSLYTARPDGSDRRLLLRRPLSPWLDGGGPAWSPDGTWIAFADVKGELHAVRSDGSGLRRLTRTRVRESGPAWLAPRQ